MQLLHSVVAGRHDLKHLPRIRDEEQHRLHHAFMFAVDLDRTLLSIAMNTYH